MSLSDPGRGWISAAGSRPGGVHASGESPSQRNERISQERVRHAVALRLRLCGPATGPPLEVRPGPGHGAVRGAQWAQPGDTTAGRGPADLPAAPPTPTRYRRIGRGRTRRHRTGLRRCRATGRRAACTSRDSPAGASGSRRHGAAKAPTRQRHRGAWLPEPRSCPWQTQTGPGWCRSGWRRARPSLNGSRFNFARRLSCGLPTSGPRCAVESLWRITDVLAIVRQDH
jgi:hypothetical protein